MLVATPLNILFSLFLNPLPYFVILLFFGAKKLPELARGLGKGIREFKDATKDVKENIEKAANTQD